MSGCSKSRLTIAPTPSQPSILVDNFGRARITDFGLATVTQNRDSVGSGSDDHDPTARWIAPEILSGDQGSYGKPVDIFSFAMVMIEVRYGWPIACETVVHSRFISMQVFTGAVPFNDLPAVAATFAIMEGRRPPRPFHPTFTDELWALTKRCWDGDYHLRPEASEVSKILRDA